MEDVHQWYKLKLVWWKLHVYPREFCCGIVKCI